MAYEKKIKSIKPEEPKISPYKVFWNWVFDGNLKSELPTGEGIPDLLSYKSPINEIFILRSFLKCQSFSLYLNKYLNNFGIRYIDRMELFMFIKSSAIDFKISKYDIFYCNQWKSNSKLYLKLRNRYKDLKDGEISYMCEIVDKSDKKELYYTSLGLDIVKKEIIKIGKKNKKNKNISLNQLMENFTLMDI